MEKNFIICWPRESITAFTLVKNVEVTILNLHAPDESASSLMALILAVFNPCEVNGAFHQTASGEIYNSVGLCEPELWTFPPLFALV